MKSLPALRVRLLLAFLPLVLSGCWTTGTTPVLRSDSAREQDRIEDKRRKDDATSREREKRFWEEHDVKRREEEVKARLKRDEKRQKKKERANERFKDEWNVARVIMHGKLPDVRKKMAREIAVDQVRRGSMTAAREASIAAAQTAAKTAVKTGAKDGAKKAASTAAKPAPSAHPSHPPPAH